MKYQAIVEAARMSGAVDLGAKRGEPGDYLVADGNGFLFVPAAVFEAFFRPLNGNGVHKTAREPEAAEEPGLFKSGQMKKLVLQALGEGPKTLHETGEWIRTHGIPDYANSNVSAILAYLSQRGMVERGEVDRKWKLKG